MAKRIQKGDLVRVLQPAFISKELYNAVGVVLRITESQRVGMIEHTDPRRIYKEHPEIYCNKDTRGEFPLYLVYTVEGRAEELFGDEIEVISSIS